MKILYKYMIGQQVNAVLLVQKVKTLLAGYALFQASIKPV